MSLRDRIMVWIAAVIVSLAYLILMLWWPNFAHARDLGQWSGQDAAIGAWFRSVMQPDNPLQSCCGPADAYFADEVETGSHGELIAIVTDERDDAPLYRPHVPIGTKIVIPPQKIQYRYGNPTGHVVLFLGAAQNVYCYVQNGGV